MDKVVITQGQADAIEYSKKVTEEDNEQIVTHHIRHQLNSNKWSSGMLMELNGLETGTLIKALYIGYEVEEEFKRGDWVVSESQVITDVIKYVGEIHVGTHNYKALHKSFFRHATPEEIAEEKQRIWWGKHNRNVWELSVGDVVNINDCTMSIVKITEDYFYFDIDLQESMCDLKRLIDVGNVEVVCFAEDRQDNAQG